MEYELTAKQIKEIDEISLDKKTTDETLTVAMNFHANRMNRLLKKEKAWWEDMKELHSLDPYKKWMVDFQGPIICIREKTKEDE